MPLFFSLQVESGQRCNFGGPAFVHGVLPRLRRVGGRAEAAAHRHRRLPRHRTGQTPSRTGAGHRAAHTLGIYHPISIALAPTSTCGFATLHLQKGHTTHYTLSKHTVIYFFFSVGGHERHRLHQGCAWRCYAGAEAPRSSFGPAGKLRLNSHANSNLPRIFN